MKYRGVEFETVEFDLEKYRRNMEDFNKRFPPVKGRAYNIYGKLVPVLGSKSRQSSTRTITIGG